MFKYIGKRFENSLTWEKELPLKEWCEKNIYLTPEVSPFPGYISYKNYPHVVEIMEDYTKTHVWQYTLLSSTQISKTTLQFSILAYELDNNPQVMLLALPSDKMVSDYIKLKLNPFLEGVKSLKEKFESYKTQEKLRDKDTVKVVPGGQLHIRGNTSSNRRSVSAKTLMLDESALLSGGMADYAEWVGRTKAFEKAGRKVLNVSSPKAFKEEEADVITQCYEQSYCKKEFHIQCKNCKEYFFPDASTFKFMSQREYKEKKGLKEEDEIDFIDYKRTASKTAHVECPNCMYKITNKDKDELVRNWNCKFVIVEGSEEDSTYAYKVNALATYISNYETIAEIIIDADEDEEALAQIYVDYFAEQYKIEVEEIEEDDLLLIGNNLEEWVVPKDTLKIYITVDNQKDYFWVEVKAFLYGNISHTIWFGRIETWSDLEQLWNECQELYDEDGNDYMASYLVIDRRGFNEGGVSRTDEADEFIAYMQQTYGRDRFYVVEGHSVLTGNKPYVITTLNKDYKGKKDKPKDIKVIKFNNTYYKDKLFRYINRTIKTATGEAEYNTNMYFLNQTIIDNDRANKNSLSPTTMLTAEVWDGEKYVKHKKKRNDIIDTSCMAFVLADIDRLSAKKKPVKVDKSKKEAIKAVASLAEL